MIKNAQHYFIYLLIHSPGNYQHWLLAIEIYTASISYYNKHIYILLLWHSGHMFSCVLHTDTTHAVVCTGCTELIQLASCNVPCGFTICLEALWVRVERLLFVHETIKQRCWVDMLHTHKLPYVKLHLTLL